MQIQHNPHLEIIEKYTYIQTNTDIHESQVTSQSMKKSFAIYM